MNVWVWYVILLMNIHLFVSNVSSADLSKGYLDNVHRQVQIYNYVKRIDSCKMKYGLEHKDFPDLMDTVSIVDKYSRYSIFTTEEVVSLIMKESKFNRLAKNKSDGGAGLGQITNIKVNFPERLAWVTDLYDKEQNIKSIFIALDMFHDQYKTKPLAIMHYNGSTYKSKMYASSVIKMSTVFGKVRGS